MNPVAKSISLAGLGFVLAGAAFWVWQQFFSRDVEIEAVHRACMAEFAAGKAKADAGAPTSPAKLPPGDSGSGIVKGLSEGVSRMLEGMSSGMGETVCGTVRDACRSDFDGRLCAAARDRYR